MTSKKAYIAFLTFRISYFTANDYTVIEAADGRSALQKFAKADVDVVITDLIMPDRCRASGNNPRL